ncbi:MAG: SRPBCC family protein [Verrucomicrobia bacterium]|nr:SRPBCC family protein [Verrucomicrobiota bacterium]MBV8483863.1 SRPBCC family protein [Verrucomicrobiota bacterium]
MGATSQSIEVNAPLQTVYHQWTQFEEFPRFMEGVEEVRYHGPNRLFWKARIAGKDKEWEAEITEQVPNRRIAWQSVDGTPNMGAVTFEPLDVSTTRITLTIEYEPEGFFEQAGDVLGIPSSQIGEDLNRFREFMEKGGSRTAPGRGGTEPLEPSGLIEPAIAKGDTPSAEQLDEQKPSFQDRKIPPAPVSAEAIASGIGRTGGGPIPGKEDEPHEKHGTIIADGPKAMAVEGSSVEENVGIDRARLRPAAPTHEQIARRAYELYLERGGKQGHEREDWATAEKELSEKSGDDRMA